MFIAVARPVFGLPGGGCVGLVVVVVVVEAQEPPLEAVIPWSHCAFQMGIDGVHPLDGSGIRAGGCGIETCIGVVPDERSHALTRDGIATDAVAPSAILGSVLPGAVHTPLAFSVVVIDRERVVGPVMGHTGGGINLWPFVSIAAHPLATEADAIAIFQAPGVEPGYTALHQGAVPVFPTVSRIAVDAMLNAHPCRRVGVGECRPELDDATERRRAVKHTACTLHDLYLFEVFQWKESPSGPSGIAAEHGQTIEQHSHPRTRSETVAAAAPDLGLAVHDGDPRGTGQALVGARGRPLIDQFRRQDIDGHAHLAEVLFEATGRNDGRSDPRHVGFEHDVQGP